MAGQSCWEGNCKYASISLGGCTDLYLTSRITVTGANQGIGLGVAEVCLANAVKVVYSLDIADPGNDFTELQGKHRNLKYIKTNVTQKESIEQAITSIYTEEGRLDGFVANAGVTKHQPALDFDEEQLHKIFELNVCSLKHGLVRQL